LATAEAVNFQVENGETVQEHFRVTEVGIITKEFIDCGGKVRHEKVENSSYGMQTTTTIA